MSGASWTPATMQARISVKNSSHLMWSYIVGQVGG